jgi:ABC-type uncharacterized transport system permease subunit
MQSTGFGILTIAAYALATGAMAASLKSAYSPPEKSGRFRLLALGWIAAALHACAIAGGGMDFAFLNVASFSVLLIVVVWLVASAFSPVDKLGIVIFPLAALAVLLRLAFAEQPHLLRDLSTPMTAHVLASMLAYSFLNIAAIQALLLAVQDWRLRAHRTYGFTRALPPLQTMESLLFKLIAAGLALLTLSLITGFLFVQDLFAQHLAHKTILSILAWGVFAVLLWGRHHHGWRGTIAIRWTLGGFASLMLAYFGSKMVLELILHRV